MTDLLFQDIQLHPLSTGTNALLFFYQGELYRAPEPKFQEAFAKVVSLSLPELQTTELTDMKLIIDDVVFFGAVTELPVYKHKLYRHMFSISEATRNQAKEMVIALCDLQSKLLANGFIIYDIHENNFYYTIEGIKWLDYGSFSGTNGFVNKDPACSYAYVKTCYLIIRYILKNFPHDAPHFTGEVLSSMGGPMKALVDSEDWSTPDAWQKLKNYVKSIDIIDTITDWSDRYPYDMKNIFNKEIHDKSLGFHILLGRMTDVSSITDVGCNKGFYTFIASKLLNAPTIAFDVDEKCIDMANRINRDEFNLPILFCKSEIKTIEKLHQDEKEKFYSDLAVALAMVHHLKIQNISAHSFVKFLISLSKKYIIIEDINSAAEYQREFFKCNWNLVQRVPSAPPGRTLSLYVKSR